MNDPTPIETIAARLAAARRAFAAARGELPSWRLSRWVFLRLLGLVYLVAFVSLWSQVEGLIGSEGVAPAADFLEAVEAQLGDEAVWRVPTLCWIDSGDGFLWLHCCAGAFFSLLTIAGVFIAPSLIVLWILYLSLSSVSGVFLGFQWDALLLETGFLAIFLAPAQPLPRFSSERPPSRLAVFLLHWLLFRLMFMSGAVKLLAASNLAWQDLSALTAHYETQPLPTWLGWHVHQLPAWFHKWSAIAVFVIELILPAFIFGFRRSRWIAFWGFSGLMGAIALTGNYTYFNLLTFALCVLLLDDRALRRMAPQRWFRLPEEHAADERKPEKQNRPRQSKAAAKAGPKRSEEAKPVDRPWRRFMRRAHLVTLALAAAVSVSVSAAAELLRLGNTFMTPDAARQKLAAYRQWSMEKLSPYRSLNTYGLFASMTLTRPEIVVEGSDDGREWKPYEFKWKPGALDRRPAFVAPHQPRLDWQMWFAALSDYRRNPWLIQFQVRLLEGEPSVLKLIGENPFPDAPPRYIRSVMYRYRFTDAEERDENGRWWKRELLGLYSPPFSLQQIRRQ